MDNRRACSVKGLAQGEPPIMRVIRVVNLNPHHRGTGIVNNSRGILTALHEVLSLSPCHNRDPELTGPDGIGGSCSVSLVMSQALIDHRGLRVLFFHDE